MDKIPLEKIIEEAQKGMDNYQFELGRRYFYGIGVTQDMVQAISLWEKAAEKGNSDAEFYLGVCYYEGNTVNQDYKKAVCLLEKAAEKENGTAQYILGICYKYGRGVEKNLKRAAYYFLMSANQGFVEAMHNIAYCYKWGEGVEQDSKKAVQWYKKAAELDNPQAQNNLGICYKLGDGVEQDYQKAIYWFTKASENEEISGDTNLGICYYNGDGVQQDFNKALTFFTSAAVKGDPTAQLGLGFCYFYGQGTAQDYKKAAYWWDKAAKSGEANSQNNLGYCYELGLGVKQNYEKAFSWYKKAALHNISLAQRNVGIAYYNGLGVEKDYQEALYWLRKALENGEEEAREICLEIENILSNQESIYPDFLYAQKRKDIFISWNQFDRNIKDSIVNTLKVNNIISCWHSDSDCNGDIEKACFDALDNAISYLFIISKNSLKSEWVKKELMHVIDKVKKGIILKNFVKPVFIDDVYQDIKKLKDEGNLDNPFVILIDLEIASTTVNSNDVNLVNIYENVKTMIIDYHKKDYVNKLYNSFERFKYFLSVQTRTNSLNSEVIPTRIDYELGYIKRKLEDEKGNITNINEVLKNDVSLIYGEGGSGKSLLISEIVRSSKDSLYFVTNCKNVYEYFEKNKQQTFYEYLKTLYIKQISDKETTDDLLINESFYNLLPEATQEVLNKKYYIILDSIDELDNDEDYNLINEKIDNFTKSHSYCKFIFTSRNKDDVDKINFTSNVNIYKLKELTEDDINSLIENIFNYINKKTTKVSQEKITEFIQTLKKVPKNIKKNPLLLTNLIVNYIKEGKILTKKYEIIDNSLKILINDLEKERNIHFKYDDVLDKSGKILEELSFQKYVDDDEETLETLERIFDSLDIVNYEAKAKEYLIYLKKRGIYINNTFVHLYFQESLAAKYCYKLLYKMEKDELQRYRLSFSKSSSGDTLLHLYTLEYFKEEEWSGPTKALIAQIDNHCKDKNLKILEETIEIIKDEIPERTIEDIKEDVESNSYYNENIIMKLLKSE